MNSQVAMCRHVSLMQENSLFSKKNFKSIIFHCAIAPEKSSGRSSHKVDITEGASVQFLIWIFNFWPYGQLRVKLIVCMLATTMQSLKQDIF